MNVYVAVPVVAVLIVDGLHVPLMPFWDVVGSAGAVVPWHSGPICANVGVICVVTSTTIVAVPAH